jgi:hypothetical protein
VSFQEWLVSFDSVVSKIRVSRLNISVAARCNRAGITKKSCRDYKNPAGVKKNPAGNSKISVLNCAGKLQKTANSKSV